MSTLLNMTTMLELTNISHAEIFLICVPRAALFTLALQSCRVQLMRVEFGDPNLERLEAKTVAETFPLGEILAEELEARGWSKAHLAAIVGRDSGMVSAIISGKKAITVETAGDLSGAFGTSPQFWLNLQTTHQLAH